MPIAMERKEDGRILYFRIADPWTVDDLDRLYIQIKLYFEQSQFPIYFLVDMTLARVIPSQFLSRIHREPLLTGPNFGGVAVVNAGAVVRALFDVEAAIFHLKPARYFRSEYEAWGYLRGEIARDRPVQP